MKEFVIRVETIDGEVNYFYLTEDFVYYDSCLGFLKVDYTKIFHKYYSEYRFVDLIFSLEYIDTDVLEVI